MVTADCRNRHGLRLEQVLGSCLCLQPHWHPSSLQVQGKRSAPLKTAVPLATPSCLVHGGLLELYCQPTKVLPIMLCVGLYELNMPDTVPFTF